MLEWLRSSSIGRSFECRTRVVGFVVQASREFRRGEHRSRLVEGVAELFESFVEVVRGVLFRVGVGGPYSAFPLEIESQFIRSNPIDLRCRQALFNERANGRSEHFFSDRVQVIEIGPV